MEKVKVLIKKVNPNVPTPTYGSEYASGFDVTFFHLGEDMQSFFDKMPIEAHSNKPWAVSKDFVILHEGSRIMLPTGLRISIPEGYEIQVRPRSGNAIKLGLTVLNTPGTIDSDYRGDCNVILINNSGSKIKIEHGMKIAQFVVVPVVQAEFEEVEELPDTVRGTSGFGSTDSQAEKGY